MEWKKEWKLGKDLPLVLPLANPGLFLPGIDAVVTELGKKLSASL